MSFEWANEASRQVVERGGLQEGETLESRYWDMAVKLGSYMGDPSVSDRFYHYMGEGYYSIATPVLANFGRETGLPISCNNSYIADDVASMLYKAAEIGMMTKHGAGTSAYLGDVRARGNSINGGGKADGCYLPAKLIQTNVTGISQGTVRRGNAAVYQDADSPDIDEFLHFREEGSDIQDLSLGVCVSDDFMNGVRNGDKKRLETWRKIIRKRFESGYPYVVFSDTVNRNAPDVYQDLKRVINGSNLCAEIALSSTHDESFVCDLSSMNALHFDEWKDTDAVELLVYFLDAVMEEYIIKTEGMPFMKHARNFALRQRAIGVGILGYHSYLQSKMVPFESFAAKGLNVAIAKTIKDKANEASKYLAVKFGEPEMLVGYGRRNVTLMAIAPTTTSSFVLGQVSPSIEPLRSNYFTKDLAKGKFTYRNPYLREVLEKYGRDDRETWRSILETDGSVQHLDWLSQLERDVFKTFSEISPLEVIQQAAARQKHIDQSQSLNLLIAPDTPLKDVNALMFEAWELGVKSLYYQRGTNPAQEAAKNIMECSACES
jgi:ribonucleoside-diphosphate reductase alpha chain